MVSYLTTEEVAEIIKVKPPTVCKYARSQHHPLVGKKTSAGWRFTPKAVESWLGMRIVKRKTTKADRQFLEAALNKVL